MAKDDLPPLGRPGQRLGRYELLQRIAVGGMAEVYRAQAAGPADFRKLVAIKRLLPQHALDPQLLRMFLDESRLMARFAHPNLPQVIDVSDGGGVDVPFFAMEHVAGVDLREIIRAAGGALPVEHVLAVSSGVAAGLHHAHELRADDGRPLEIVHRDVSPSNVLISFDGGVKVADFGVAKWSQQKSFTYQGQLKGKFAHMSPEQCRGEPLDRRSDVFALGTLMYEMATGQPPFRANSEFELLSRIATHDATWPTDSDTAPELRAIVMRALKRERAERYATTREIQLELEAFGRERRLIVSAVELAAYVESLFAAKVAEWRASPSGAEDQAEDDFARIGVERTATDVFALEKTLVSRGDGSAKAENPPAEPAAKPGGATAGPEPQAAPTSAGPHRGAAHSSAGSRPRGKLIAAGLAAAALLAVGIYRLVPTTRGTSSTKTVATPLVPPDVPAIAQPPVAPAKLAADKEHPTVAPEREVTGPLPSRTGADSNARPTRSGRTRRGEKDPARLALSPATTPTPAAPEDGSKAAPTKAPAPTDAVAAPAKPTPFSTPRPAATKIWDPDSPVPP